MVISVRKYPPQITYTEWNQLVDDIKALNNIISDYNINQGQASSFIISGSDGDKNRVITLSNATISSNEKIFRDGQRLVKNIQYTISHNSASSTVTIIDELFDDQLLIIEYDT